MQIVAGDLNVKVLQKKNTASLRNNSVFSIIVFHFKVFRRFGSGRKGREQDKKRAVFPINTLYGVLHTAFCGSGQTVSIPAETYTPEALSIHSQYTHIELHTRCIGLLHKAQANTIALRTSYGFLWPAETELSQGGGFFRQEGLFKWQASRNARKKQEKRRTNAT